MNEKVNINALIKRQTNQYNIRTIVRSVWFIMSLGVGLFWFIFSIRSIKIIVKEKDSIIAQQSESENILRTHVSWAYNLASKNNMPYYFSIITMHISAFDTTITNKKYRKLQIRTQYTLDALRDIDSTEDIFLEQYVSMEAEVIRWKGSHPEVNYSIHDNSYWVRFSAKKGQQKGIVTGTDFLYSYPLKKNSENILLNGKIQDSNQKAFYYPNTMDYINSFVIKIDSLGPDIRLPENSMIRKGNESLVIGKPGRLYKKTDTQSLPQKKLPYDKYEGLICEWQNLKPADIVGIILNW